MKPFEKNDVVCFYGDSITHAGKWMRRIYAAHRAAGIPIELYNCGVAGTNATTARGARQDLLFCHQPTVVVFMFGMNDVGRHLYDGRPADGGVIVERRMRIDGCVISTEQMARELKNKGVRLVFCTPTPYDELSEREEKCYTGVAAAVHEIGERVTALAAELGADVVDFNGKMTEHLKEWFKIGDSFIGADRVHPDARGHELMASIFLEEQGFDSAKDKTPAELAALADTPYDAWEEKRYELEQHAKSQDLFEWSMMAGVRSKEIRRKEMEILVKNEAEPEWIRELADKYLHSGFDRDTAMAALIDFTKTVGESL